MEDKVKGIANWNMKDNTDTDDEEQDQHDNYNNEEYENMLTASYQSCLNNRDNGDQHAVDESVNGIIDISARTNTRTPSSEQAMDNAEDAEQEAQPEEEEPDITEAEHLNPLTDHDYYLWQTYNIQQQHMDMKDKTKAMGIFANDDKLGAAAKSFEDVRFHFLQMATSMNDYTQPESAEFKDPSTPHGPSEE
eukprot:gene41939-55646_t